MCFHPGKEEQTGRVNKFSALDRLDEGRRDEDRGREKAGKEPVDVNRFRSSRTDGRGTESKGRR